MEFDQNALGIWEQEQYDKVVRRAFKVSKNYRCPRQEALRDYRHRGYLKGCIGKETKWVRKWTNRHFRRVLARNLYNEVYYNRSRNRDYRTGGWICW